MAFRKRLSAAALVLTATLVAAAPALAEGPSAAAFTPSASLAAATNNRIGLHSMLFPDTPFSAQEEMFRQAKAAGASYIRVDLSLSAIFTRGEYRGYPFYRTTWTQTDQYATLSNRYGVKVLAIIYATPWFIADCPPGVTQADAYHCPVADLARYQQMVSEVASRYAGVINDFEILNEPDIGRYFYGSPQQYAALLGAAADGIHAANPRGRVALGGISKISTTAFTDAVLAADASLPAKIDINTIHLRSTSSTAAANVARWRQYFNDHGMRGPLWLTEFGYPADGVFQYDSKYRGAGEASQAAYLEATMPVIVGAGGDMIFVTQRDWGKDHFASEGILSAPNPLPANPVVTRRQSFAVVQRAAASLTAPPPPAAPGITRISARQSSRVRLVGGKLALRFACADTTDCLAARFRLVFSSRRGYQLRTPVIKAGRTLTTTVPLSASSVRSLKRSGGKGLRFSLTNAGGLKLRKMTLIR